MQSRAVAAAHECGVLLIAEKSFVDQTRETARTAAKTARESRRPNLKQEDFWRDLKWEEWFAAKIGEKLPLIMAERFMRFARQHAEQTLFEFERAPNAMRSGLLALELFPRKEHAGIMGDSNVPSIAQHLSIITRFNAWLRDNDPSKLKLTGETRRAWLEDFAPVAQFIDRLRGNRPK